MRTTIAVAALLCAAPAFADVTSKQLRNFLDDKPEAWEPELAEIHPLVERTPADLTLRNAASLLAKRWNISEKAAWNLIVGVVLDKDDDLDYRRKAEEVGKLFDAAERLAPDSAKVWALVLEFRRDQFGCSQEL